MVAAFALMSVAFANDTENEENRVQPRSSEYLDLIPEVLLQRATGSLKSSHYFLQCEPVKKRTIPEMPEYYTAKGCTEKALDETIE